MQFKLIATYQKKYFSLRYAALLMLAIFSCVGYAEITIPNSIDPWQLNILGDYRGNVTANSSSGTLSISSSGGCQIDDKIGYSFDKPDGTEVEYLGFYSSKAAHNIEILQNALHINTDTRFFVLSSYRIDRPVLSLEADILVSSSSSNEASSPTLFLYSGQSSYGFRHRSSINGHFWQLVEMDSSGNEVLLSEVPSDQTLPNIARNVQLSLTNNRITLLVDSQNIGLSYSHTSSFPEFTSFGISHTNPSLSDTTSINNLYIHSEVNSSCPELDDSGEREERYAIVSLNQKLHEQGSVTVNIANLHNTQQAPWILAIRQNNHRLSDAVFFTVDNGHYTLYDRSSGIQQVITPSTPLDVSNSWLRIERSATTFTYSVSDTADSWSQLASYESNITDIAFVSLESRVENTSPSSTEFSNPDVINKVSGSLTKNTTFYKNQRYNIENNLVVPQGIRLVIEEGAELFIDRNRKLQIEGELSVLGVNNNPVKFQPLDGRTVQGAWNGIEVINNGVANLEYANISYATNGIYFNNTQGSVLNSYFNGSATAIAVQGASSPSIEHNHITQNITGISIRGQANSEGMPEPYISSNIITSNTTYGINISGVYNSAFDPNPVIRRNIIENNSTTNGRALRAYYFANSHGIKIDARENWWGSTEPSFIEDKIYHYQDSKNYSPFVDFSAYLTSSEGEPVARQQLSGAITASTSLLAGQSYEVLTDLVIGTGRQLTIPEGVTFNFVDKTKLDIRGELRLQGSSASPIRLTSTSSNPKANSWDGVNVGEGANIVFEHVLLEYSKGLHFLNASGDVRNSEFRHNSIGITIEGNSNPTIGAGNMIRDNTSHGIVIRGKNNSGGKTVPVIENSTIINNAIYGIYVAGVFNTQVDPAPTITNNGIYNNGRYNIYSYAFEDPENVIISVKNNWWGTSDLKRITDSIYDYAESFNYSPFVDFSNFLLSENGEAEPSIGLLGTLSDTRTLDSSTPYLLLNKLIIEPSAHVTIAPGSIIKGVDKSSIVVKGQLEVNGLLTAKVLLSSALASPKKSSWDGIQVIDSGYASINYSTIEYAKNGVYFYSGNGRLANSEIKNNTNGVRIHGNSSPFIGEGNVISENNNGIKVEGHNSASDSPKPQIINNTIVHNSYYGVELRGVNNVAKDPKPIINNNRIHSNNRYNLYAYYFAENDKTIVNATNNWWGAANPKDFYAKIYDYVNSSTYAPFVDFGQYLDAENGIPNTAVSLLGSYSGNHVLSNESYLLLSDLIIESGANVSVASGVKISAIDDAEIIVRGNFNLVGQQNSKTVLTSANDLPSTASWEGIYITQGGRVNIDHASIFYAKEGVYFDNASGNISNSEIRYNTKGISIVGDSSPMITDHNIIANNLTGIEIKSANNATSAPSPLINSNIITQNTSYGIYAYGSRNASLDPRPVVTDNSILDNNRHNYYAYYFADATTTILDATNNWWGSSDLAEIGNKIFDNSDQPSYAPIVNITNYLAQDPQSTSQDNNIQVLSSAVTSDTVLDAGDYYLRSDMTVTQGSVLTLNADVNILVEGDYAIVVDGILRAQGSIDSQVKFSSSSALPSKQDWKGIQVRSTGSLELSFSSVQHAFKGIEFIGASGVISNSIIKDNTTGIYLNGNSEPTIGANNEITNNIDGVTIIANNASASNPIAIIEHNKIHANTRDGIKLQGINQQLKDPLPIIRGNQIVNNGDYNISALNYGQSQAVLINARENWWGSTDLTAITNGLYDYNDNRSSPFIDFRQALISQSGEPGDTNILLGNIDSDLSIDLTTPYHISGELVVSTNATFTIGAGAILNMQAGSSIRVEGHLNTQGTSGAPVTFTSSEANPTSGNWKGIIITSGAAVTIHNAIVEYAQKGLHLINSEGRISESTFRYNKVGISIEGGNSPIIESGNVISENNDGIEINGRNCYPLRLTPIIRNNTISQNNAIGIRINGLSNRQFDPLPVVNGNIIRNNGIYNISATRYADAADVVLDVRENNWGISDVTLINETIEDHVDSPIAPFIDWSYQELGPTIVGKIKQNTLLQENTSYFALSDILVPENIELSMQAGAQLKMLGDFSLEVSGSLLIGGEQQSPSIISYHSDFPAKDKWQGIIIKPSASANINYAHIESAFIAIQLDGSEGLIQNSIISHSNTGVQTNNLATLELRNSEIKQNSTGIYMSSLGIQTSSVEGVIVGNDIFANTIYGIHLRGSSNDSVDPRPVINNNNIYNNGGYNLYSFGYSSDNNITINAANNWWGSRDIDIISTTIYDRRDLASAPLANFSNFLSSIDGPPVTGTMIAGDITNATTLIPGETYSVVSNLNVVEGASLTIPAGTTVNFAEGTAIKVNGQLAIEGTQEAPAVFKGLGTNSTNNLWDGIFVENGDINFSYLLINNAAIALNIFNSSGSITHSTFEQNQIAIRMENTNNESIEVRQSKIINNTNIGFELLAGRPLVRNNQIHTNSTNVEVKANAASEPNLVDFRQNWWGTDDILSITQSIKDASDSYSINLYIDYNEFQLSEAGEYFDQLVLLGPLENNFQFAANTHYIVGGRLLLKDATNTHIPQGVSFDIAGPFSIELNKNSQLSITGNADNLVTFSSTHAAVSDDAWKGIIIRDNAEVNWLYTRISNAKVGVLLGFETTGNISQSSFIDNTLGLAFTSKSAVEMDNSVISTNDIGLSIGSHSRPKIRDSRIVSNHKYGVEINNKAYYSELTGTNIPTTGVAQTSSSGGSSSSGASRGAVASAPPPPPEGPPPFVSNSQIFDNKEFNVFVTKGSHEYGVFDFTANYWGTTDIYAIANSISDKTDEADIYGLNGIIFGSDYEPVTSLVDYRDFTHLNQEPAMPENVLFKDLDGNTVLQEGIEYWLLSDLRLTSDTHLTIPANVKIRAVKNADIFSTGSNLTFNGTSTSPIVFTSAKTNDQLAEDWQGIVVKGGSHTFNHVAVEFATTGLVLDTTRDQANISNSRFSNNKNGLKLLGHNRSQIDSSIFNYNDTGIVGYGFYQCRPESTGGAIAGTSGLVDGVHSQITNSIIANNKTNGIVLDGNKNYQGCTAIEISLEPNLTTLNNKYFDNGDYHVYLRDYKGAVNASNTLDFTQSWWGTNDPYEITDLIYDGSDHDDAPYINFAQYLTSLNGSPNTDPAIVGILNSHTDLLADEHYLMLGKVKVEEGVNLNIQPGALVQMIGQAELTIAGSLNVSGTTHNPAVFTSLQNNASFGDWKGIHILPGGTANIDHALVEYANSGIWFEDSNGSISNSDIENNNTGVLVSGESLVTIASHNNITKNKVGIKFNKAKEVNSMASVIRDNTIAYNLQQGIELKGDNTSVFTDQQLPVITHNHINDNQYYNIHVSTYPADSGRLVIDAKENWWGTRDITEINNTLYDGSDINTHRTPFVDYSSFWTIPTGTPHSEPYLLGAFTEDTVLTANAQYNILGSLRIPEGISLTIEAGVKFNFVGSFDFSVSGNLNISGSEQNNAVFASSFITPKLDEWKGISLDEGAHYTISHLTIRDAKSALLLNDASGSVRQTYFSNNTDAISIEYNSQSNIIENNTFYKNTSGIRFKNQVKRLGEEALVVPSIRFNTFIDNTFYNVLSIPGTIWDDTIINLQQNWWDRPPLPKLPPLYMTTLKVTAHLLTTVSIC